MSQEETLTSEHPTTGLDRSSRPWLAGIAAVAVGVVVAGTVGYSLGQGSDTPGGAAAAMGLSSRSSNAVNDGRPGMMGAPEPVVAGDQRMGVDMMMPFGYGRVVFSATGLSTDAASSTAYAYDPNQVFSKQTAADAAAALGLKGEPTLVDGSWMVGSQDGSGPVMWLMPDGMASLSFYDQSTDPYSCGVGLAEGDGSTVDSSGGSAGLGGSTDPGPPQPLCAHSVPDAPQGDAAIDRVKALLNALGVDASGYEFEVGDSGTPQATYVAAFQVIDGQRTGATWSVGLVGRQIQSVDGELAPLVSLGNYAVVGPATAVKRLSDPRFGSGSVGGPMPYASDTPVVGMGMMEKGTDIVGPGPDTAVRSKPSLPPTIEPGSSFSWPVQEVTIVKSRLGLALYTQPNGSTVLLPTYELSDADGQTWSVVAVDDTSLDFSE